MATLAILPLTTSTGGTLSIATTQVVSAYNDSNTKAVLTYEKSGGGNDTKTLTISMAALQAMATQALFIENNLTDGGNADWLFNNTRVVKLFDNSGDCDMYYNTSERATNKKFLIRASAATVSGDCGKTILITDNIQSLAYYIAGANVRNIYETPVTTGANNSTASAAVLAAAGSGYTNPFIAIVSGGVFITPATITVASLKLVSAAVNAAGTSYAPEDIIIAAGGTGTKASIEVLTTKVVAFPSTATAAGTGAEPSQVYTIVGGAGASAANVVLTHTKAVGVPQIASGGATYVVNNHVSFATGTGTQAVYNVTAVDGGGAITALVLISGGDYTVNPTPSATAATTTNSIAGAGLTFNVPTATSVRAIMGALTFNTTPNFTGSYTTNALGALATTSAFGTGTTITMILADYGIGTIDIDGGGAYTATSTSLTQFSTGGSGTGATFNSALYGVQDYSLTDGGDYSTTPANPVSTTGGGSHGATFNMTFAGSVTKIVFDDKQNATNVVLFVDETKVEIETAIGLL